MLQNKPSAPGNDPKHVGGKRSGTGTDGPAQKQLKGGPDTIPDYTPTTAMARYVHRRYAINWRHLERSGGAGWRGGK